MRARSRIALLGVALAFAGCDRNLHPYDPDEQPRQPDLSRIFPAGAERAESTQPGLPAAPDAGRGAPPVAEESGAPIHGTIQLAEGLESRMTPGSVLFLIARRQEGGPPLAVKRIPSPRFPLDFELGPDDRMIQALPFAGPFSLSARVDSDGNAMSRTPGDLQGEAPGPFEPGTDGILLVIDQVVPSPPQS